MKKPQNESFAKITIDKKEYDLPIEVGSEGPKGIDVRSLYKNSGCFTFDPAFMSTASCRSRITYINGEGEKEGGEGILRYTGYSIKDLAVNGDFLEAAYLILHGELPTSSQREDFIQDIYQHMWIPEKLENIFFAFPKKSHPM